MPPINRIELRIITGDRINAGTDGAVFLGAAGREFNVDSQGDVNDFERNSDRTYIFGEGATVQRPQENDPRTPWQTDSNDLVVNPVYIRFEPGDGGDWNIERVHLKVLTVNVPTVIELDRLEGPANLWLGETRGKFLFLSQGPPSK